MKPKNYSEYIPENNHVCIHSLIFKFDNYYFPSKFTKLGSKIRQTVSRNDNKGKKPFRLPTFAMCLLWIQSQKQHRDEGK